MLEHSKGAVVLIMQQSTDATNNQQERLIDFAWLAGLWEGEGTFSIVSGSKKRLYPIATIINTDMSMIDEISRVLHKYNVGHLIVHRKGGCDNNPKHSDAKEIKLVGAKRVKTFLDLLLPQIRNKKKPIAALVLEYANRRILLGRNRRYNSIDFDYVSKVRKLNKKGPSESSETIRQPSKDEDIVQTI